MAASRLYAHLVMKPAAAGRSSVGARTVAIASTNDAPRGH
jgi:hypothetical protein